MLRALMKADRLDHVRGDEEVSALIDDLLVSPVLRRVLCNPTNFSFNPNSVIQARIDRVELGDFDALVLGLLLMSHTKSQLVVPEDFTVGTSTRGSSARNGSLRERIFSTSSPRGCGEQYCLSMKRYRAARRSRMPRS
jgi:hypothetical protein